MSRVAAWLRAVLAFFVLSTLVLGGCETAVVGQPAPIAVAGADRVARIGGAPIILDGSESHLAGRPGERPEAFQWSVAVSPSGASGEAAATIADPAAMRTEVVVQEPGLYVLRLDVYQNGRIGRPAYVNIRARRVPLPPVAVAGADIEVDPGDPVTLDGSASHSPDGVAFNWYWRQVDGPTVALEGTDRPDPSFQAPAPAGPLTFALIVTDARGLVSEEDQVTVTVRSLPPVAVIQAPTSVDETEIVILDGRFSHDPNNEIIIGWSWSVDWPGGSIDLVDGDTDRASFQAPRIAGTVPPIQVTLTVTNQSDLSDTASHTIYVQDVINDPPVADAGADLAVGELESVSLDATGSSDPNGDALTYWWYYDDDGTGPAITLSNPDTATPSFVSPRIDETTVLEFVVVVDDGRGLTDTDGVTVTVERTIVDLVITGQPPAAVETGAPFSITVDVHDTSGARALGATDEITLALVDDSNASLAGTLTRPANDGRAIFSGLSVSGIASGLQIIATSPRLSSATTNPFDVIAGPVDSIAVTTQPPNEVTAGSQYTVAVTAYDADNNVATDFSGTISLFLQGGNIDATLGGTTAVSAVEGVATFDDLYVDLAATGYVLRADTAGANPVDSDPFAVRAGPATELSISVQPPSEVAAGDAFGLTVIAVDDYGNRDPDFTGDITVGIETGPGDGALTGTETVSATEGTAVFSGLSLNRVGTYVLNAEATGIAAATTDDVVVRPGAPAAVVIVDDPGASVTAGDAFTIVAEVRDAEGNLVDDFTGEVFVAIDTGPAEGSLSGPAQLNAEGGVATFDALWLDRVGSYVLEVGSGTLETATTGSIDVTPADAYRVTVTNHPSVRTVDQTFSVTVEIHDAYGNLRDDSDASVAIAIASGPGVLSGNTDAAATGGVATFEGLALNEEGDYVLEVTSAGLIAGTTGQIQVLLRPPTHLKVTIYPVTVTAGIEFEVVVEARDAEEDVATDFTGQITLALDDTVSPPGAPFAGTLTLPAVEGVATFSDLILTRAGSYVIEATTPDLDPDQTDPFEVEPDEPAQLAIISPPHTVDAGACANPLTVELQDQYGNASPDTADTTITFTSNTGTTEFRANATCGGGNASTRLIPAGNTEVSLSFRDDTAGDLVITASAPDLDPGQQTQTIRPRAPFTVVLTTDPHTVTAGACSPPVTAEVQDDLGNPSPVDADLDLDLSADSGTLVFYTDDNCMTLAGTTVTIEADTSAATFYLRDTTAGTPTITVNPDGFDPIPQGHTIVPGAVSGLFIRTPSRTIVAGDCSGEVRIGSGDTYGNAAPVTADTEIRLAADPDNLSFFSDASCTSVLPGSAITLLESETEVAIYFSGEIASEPLLMVDAADLDGDQQIQTIEAGAPSVLAFLTPPRTLDAGDCSAVLEVETRDGFGNTSPVTGAASFDLSADSTTLTFHASGDCTDAAIDSVALTEGESVIGFYFRDTTSGEPAITVDAAGFTPAEQTQTVNPADASILVFGTGPQTLDAGACSGAVSVHTDDEYGNPAPVAENTTVTVAATGTTTLAFYTDAGCTDPLGAVTFTPEESAVTFYFADSTPGTPTITVDADGLEAAMQDQVIEPGPATDLAFATDPHEVTAGDCSPVVTVESRDAEGNPSAVDEDLMVALSSTPGGLAFYPDGTCTGGTEITEITILTGTSQASFHVRGTTAEIYDVIADSALGAPSQAYTVIPGPASVLGFTTTAHTVDAGACSDTLTVASFDAYGNAVAPEEAVALTFSGSTGTTSFRRNNNCAQALPAQTLDADTPSVNFRFVDTTAGDLDLIVSATGFTAAEQTQIVEPLAPTRLAFVTPERSTGAGACSDEMTVEARDQYGNTSPVAANTTLLLSAEPTGPVFFSDPGCADDVEAVPAIIPEDQSQGSFWLSATTADVYAITADAAGYAEAAQQNHEITGGPPDRLVIVSDPHEVGVGECSGDVVIEVRDDQGNPATVPGGFTINLSGDSDTLAFFVGTACDTAGDEIVLAAGQTVAVASFQDLTVGTPSVDVDGPVGVVGDSQIQTIVPGPATVVAIVSAAHTTPAGACTGPVTVQTRDAGGNVAPVNADTAFDLGGPTTMTFFSADGCAGADATTTVTVLADQSEASFWFIETTAGTDRTITVDRADFTGDAQDQTVTPLAPSQLSIVSAAHVVDADVCATPLTIETQDTYGNPSPVAGDTQVDLASTSGTLVFRRQDCGGPQIASATILGGQAQTSVSFSDQTAGSPEITVSATGLDPDQQTQTIQPLDAVRVDIVSDPQTVTAGACSDAVVLRAFDTFDNVTTVNGDVGVALSADSGTLTFHTVADCAPESEVTAVTILDGTGEVSFYFRDTTVGSPVLTANPDGFDPVDQMQEVEAGTGTTIVIASYPAQVQIDGAFTVVAEVHDDFGNLATDHVGDLDIDKRPGGAGGPGNLGGTLSVAVVEGVATFGDLTLDALGDHQLRVTGAGLTDADTGVIEVVDVAATDLVITVQPPATETAGETFTVEAQARDAENQLVTGFTGQVTIAIATGPGEGVLSGTLTVAAVEGVATFSDIWLNRVGTYTLEVTSDGLQPDVTDPIEITPDVPAQLAFVTDAHTVDAGVCSPAVAFEVQDQFGNASPVAEETTVSIESSSTTMEFRGQANCGGQPVTQRVIAANASTADPFFFRDDTAGSPVLTIVAAGLDPDDQIHTVSPLAPAAVVFDTNPLTVTAGDCSGLLILESRDSLGNAAPVAADLAIALSSDSTSLAFFVDETCEAGTEVTGITLPEGQSSVSFRFRDTTAGTPEITADPDGFDPVAQTQTVEAGAATQLAVTIQPPPSVSVDEPFGLVVEAHDAYGNVDPSYTADVSVDIHPDFNPGPGTLSGTDTVAAAAGVATFSGLSIDVEGDGYRLRATSGTLNRAGTDLFDVAIVATRIVVTLNPPDPVSVGNTFTVVAQAQDDFGNLASAFTGPVTIAIATNPGGATLEGVTSTFAVDGVMAFVDLALDRPGTGYVLQVTDDAAVLTAGDTDPFDVEAFEAGAGTPEDPYQIANVYQLQMMNDFLDAHFVLAGDIDASETASWNGEDGFLPVGSDNDRFTGTFDGQGHVITGVYIDRPNTGGVGLFGVAENGAIIENVCVRDVDITGSNEVGGIVGRTRDNVVVRRVCSTGRVEATDEEVGGVVGRNDGDRIEDSYARTAVFVGNRRGGGLVGQNDSSVLRSYATGAVQNNTETGGLIGRGGGGTDSFWDMETSGRTDSNGGAGRTTEEMKDVRTFTDEGFNPDLGTAWDFVDDPFDDTGTDDVWNLDSDRVVNDGYPVLEVVDGLGTGAFTLVTLDMQAPVGSGTVDPVAGVHTHTRNVTVTLTATPDTGWKFMGWTGDVAEPALEVTTITLNASKIVEATFEPLFAGGDGSAGNPYQIEDVYDLQGMRLDLAASYVIINDFDASLSATWNDGAGFEPVGTDGTRFTGTLDGQGHVIYGLTINRPGRAANQGTGLFGYTGGSAIANLCLKDVDIVGSENVGALVGRTRLITSALEQVCATGNVSGVRAVGGLIGRHQGALADGYARVAVIGTDREVGGLLGRTDGGNTNRTYSTGAVGGTTNDVGGLIGRTGGGALTSGSYWDTETSGQATSAGGEGRTTAQMKTESNYLLWDFTGVWNLDATETIAAGYPYLRVIWE